MNRTIPYSILMDKIKFIDENSYILVNILDQLIDEKTVLEVLTGFIISDRPLEKCQDIDELSGLLELNRDLFVPKDYHVVDSYTVIFQIANYVNETVNDDTEKLELRNKLRKYTRNFQNSGEFSRGFSKFITFEEGKTLVKNK